MPAKYEWPEGTFEERRDVVARIAWVVYRHGPVESEDGRAAAKLAELLVEYDVDISGGYLNKTLSEMDGADAKYGDLIFRDINGKRTYSISAARDPKTQPFPSDPFQSFSPAPKTETQPALNLNEVEEVEDVYEVPVDDIDAEAEIDPDFAEVETEAASTELAVLAQPSATDKILYIQSMLSEVLGDLLTEPQRSFEAQLDERLGAVNRVFDENHRLQEENRKLRADNATLARALQQNNTMLRSRLSRNGDPTVAAHA